MEAMSQRWLAAIDQWENRRERMHAEACEDVLRFAFALGERVVHRLLRVDPSIVRDQMAVALRSLGRPSGLQISINPDDRGLIEQALPDVKSALGRTAHVHLHDDPAVERGGCVLATTGGYVDATIDTQLDRLAEALLREGRLITRTAPAGTAKVAPAPTAHDAP
jgi:flagellar assembly protein FliH